LATADRVPVIENTPIIEKTVKPNAYLANECHSQSIAVLPHCPKIEFCSDLAGISLQIPISAVFSEVDGESLA
jgi:hypothetical protein